MLKACVTATIEELQYLKHVYGLGDVGFIANASTLNTLTSALNPKPYDFLPSFLKVLCYTRAISRLRQDIMSWKS